MSKVVSSDLYQRRKSGGEEEGFAPVCDTVSVADLGLWRLRATHAAT